MQDIFNITEVEVSGSIHFLHMENIVVEEKVNEHGKMTVSGIIEEKRKEEILNSSLIGSGISLYSRKQERPLFSGIIDEVSFSETGKLCCVEVICSSYTRLWDRKKVSHSFQDATMRYRDVLQRAFQYSDVRGRLLVTAEQMKEEIHYPIIQFEETLWEFIKRIAGRCKTVIIPEVTYALPQLSVGCIRGTRYELTQVFDYQEMLNLDAFRRSFGRKEKGSYISYQVKCQENFELGDRVVFKGKELRVMQKELRLNGGYLEGKYCLGSEEEFCVRGEGNKKLQGTSLQGIVTDRKEGMVKVHLDIDRTQRNEDAFWYPYTPVTGNMLYSVPECGSRIFLTIMDMEGHASVSGCIREASDNLPETEKKIMQAGRGQYIASPEYMGFVREKDKSLEALCLDNELGVVIHTENGFSVKASGKIVLRAGNEICFETVRKFELKHPKAREEQAWIKMECAKMQLGGKQILQSGNERSEGVGVRRTKNVFTETECAEIAAGMTPICWSEGMYQAEAEGLEIMQCLMVDDVSNGIINPYGSDDILMEETETKVIAGVDSEDSEDDGEIKASVYVMGRKFDGYVLNGKTYVYQDDYRYRQMLSAFLNDVQLQDDELYLSVEEIAVIMNCMDILSSWKQRENLRIVICNPDAKIGHLKVIRKEN